MQDRAYGLRRIPFYEVGLIRGSERSATYTADRTGKVASLSPRGSYPLSYSPVGLACL